jgi:hypothetical protein
MRGILLIFLALLAGAPALPAVPTVAAVRGSAAREVEVIFIAYFWKARPGREAEYDAYIKNVAMPIDEDARRAGAFEELRSYVPEKPNGEWTHLRVFRLKSQAQYDAFTAAMDAAGKRMWPDAEKRPKADELRDLVRREVWRGFP